MDIFCCQDKVPVCPKCVVEKHGKHDVVSLSQVFEQTKEDVFDKLQQVSFSSSSYLQLFQSIVFLKKKKKQKKTKKKKQKKKQLTVLQENASAALNATNASLSRLDLDALNAANQVTLLMSELRSVIDQREKELLESIENHRKEQEKRLPIEKEELEYLIESMRHCFEYTSHLLDHGSPIELVSTSQAVLSRLSTLLSSFIAPSPHAQEPSVQLVGTKEEEVLSILSSIGRVVALRPFSSQSSFARLFTRDYSRVEKVVRQIGSYGKGDLQFDWPSGMAIDDKGRIFLADSDNHRIQCLTSQGNFLFKFGSEGKGNREFRLPRDVTFDSKNQRILVADTLNHRIQVFDFEGSFLFSFGSEGKQDGKFDRPFGIATDFAGNIFVSDKNNHRVQVFDEQGKFMRKFGSEGRAQGELQSPFGIGILSNGDVVVVEYKGGNQRLSIFNSQGKFIRFIGEKIKRPHWLFIDSHDNILVAENGTSSSVFVLSKEGDVLKQFGSGCFTRAWGVVMNQNGEIFVSGTAKNSQHGIWVF